jgi:hypothetical protein
MRMHPTLNRKLHRVAGDYAGDPKRAHEIVKLFARQEFGVESVAHLTNAQAQELMRRMRASRVEQVHRARLLANDMTDEEASITQQRYIRDLQTKLGWSDAYMEKLLQNRWGEFCDPSQRTIAHIPRWIAVRLIALMRQRLTSKHHSGGHDEIQPGRSNHAPSSTAIP